MNFQSIIHEIQQLQFYPTSITQSNVNSKTSNINNQPSTQSESGIAITNETRINNLIKIVNYIQNIELNSYTTTHANIQQSSHRITISTKKIAEITECNDKQTFIDAFFYLCGSQWHLLDPYYIYTYDDLDKKEHYFIELSEEDIEKSQLTGFLHHKTLSNSNPIPFQLERTYIYFQLSEQAKQLIQLKSMNG